MKYFDYAATTPLDPIAHDTYTQVALDYYGNPNSLHDIGGVSSDILENCRREIAEMLQLSKDGLFFTSGGSEGNFLAIEALLTAPLKKGKHIITGKAEHSSIHGVLKRLERHGYEITCLPFTGSGIIDPGRLLKEIRPDTVLVAIQHVNSEIGTIQPVKEIGEICRANNIHFHSDFVQSIGKLDTGLYTKHVTSLSFSGHKLYGPKGTGCVYIDPKVRWLPFFPDTSHEKGIRPGTVNVPGVAGMAVALQKAASQTAENLERYGKLREALIQGLSPLKENVKIYGSSGNQQYPGIIGLGINGIEGQWLMLECNRRGYAISTGTACQAGMQNASRTISAIGIEGKEAKEYVRISLGNITTLEDVQSLSASIVEIAEKFYKKA